MNILKPAKFEFTKWNCTTFFLCGFLAGAVVVEMLGDPKRRGYLMITVIVCIITAMNTFKRGKPAQENEASKKLHNFAAELEEEINPNNRFHSIAGSARSE
jgi:hypothetical protein